MKIFAHGTFCGVSHNVRLETNQQIWKVSIIQIQPKWNNIRNLKKKDETEGDL